MNRLAASMPRSSAAASCRPVTAAQASAVSSSRTEVSSMNRATSGGCLLEDLTDEVLGDRVAAHIQRPRHLRRVRGAAQPQRGHLQGRGPPLAALVQQRQVTGGDLHAEVRQQRAALGQREIQVPVAQLAQLIRQAQPVQPQRRVGPAGQHQLRGPGRPALHQIGHAAPPRPLRRGSRQPRSPTRPAASRRRSRSRRSHLRTPRRPSPAAPRPRRRTPAPPPGEPR